MEVTDSEGARATAIFSFFVLPENDPPVLQSTLAAYDSSTRTYDGLSDVVESVDLLTVREDQDTAVLGLSVRDADFDVHVVDYFGGESSSMGSGLIEVTLHASNGTTSLGAGVAGYTYLIGDGVDDRILAFRTSLAGANRALAGLTYRGRPDFYGTDDLIITVDDVGNFGRGALCAESASQDIGISHDYTMCPQVTGIL